MDQRRQLTLILLRPDGSNRTWVLTRRRIATAVAVLLAIVMIGLAIVTWAVWSHRRYGELAGRFELLAGREVMALSPQPTPVDDIPLQTESEATGPVPASPTPELSEPVREYTAPAPVRLEDFEQRRPLPGVIELRLQLTKTEWDGSLLEGYVVAMIEDLVRPESSLTNPPLGMRDGRPIEPRAGDYFAIRRFKPLVYRFETPADFVMGDIRILVYDSEGELILERTW